MNLFVRSALVVTVTLIAVSMFVFGEDESTSFRGETTVNVVEVPVRVIDKRTGEPVVGLTAADFEILEDGVPQPISNFAELWRSEDDAVEIADFDPSSPVAASQDIRTRTVELVYLVDLFLMNKVGRDRSVDGLRSAYQGGVPDGQNISLVAFNGELETLADRTDERDEILDALDELGYVKTRGNQQTIGFSDELIDTEVSPERDQAYYERRQRNRQFMGDLEKKTRRVGDAAIATMSRFAAADGRRVMVLFTPGQPRTDWVPEYSTVDFMNAEVEYPVHDLWHEIALEAADLGFTLYIVDSSGVRVNFGSDVEVGITDTVARAFDQGSVFRAENDIDLGDFDPLVFIWLGNRSRIAAHHDLPDNVACCAAGRRRFTLFPPGEIANLYPGPIDFNPAGQTISMVDFNAPDYDRFPRFRKALEQAQLAELEPGDAVFIPSMWWHHVEGQEDLNVLVNYWWRPVPAFMDTPANVLEYALLAMRDLPRKERAAWKEIFDFYVFDFDEESVSHIPEERRGALAPMTDLLARRLRAQLLRKLNR